MNKSDLIDDVANATGMSKSEVGTALDGILDSITRALKNGSKVSIAGFGNFDVSKRAARKGRNPRTGEEIMIAASNSVRFKAGKQLKDEVN